MKKSAYPPRSVVLSLIFGIFALVQLPAADSSAQQAPSSSPLPSATAKPSPKPRMPDDAITPSIKNRERHERFLYRIKEGKVGLLFLGDSITDGWPRNGEWSWLKFAPYQPANFGISGDRTEHVLWRITNGELDGIDPKVTVVMIGTNNVGQNSDEKPEWAAEGVKKIITTVREKLPKTKILLLAVFPRAVVGDPMRDRIAEINRIIAQLDDGKIIRFLDIGKVFLDEAGEIPPDVMPDKLHPSAKGYDLWYDAMHPLLEEMMK